MKDENKKCKILFVMESLRIGGAEKSLISLLSKIDYEKYEVELLLFHHHGELMNFLPHQVKLIPEDRSYRVFADNWKTAFVRYLFRGDIKRFWYSLLYLIGVIKYRIKREPLYIGWEMVRNLFEKREFKADIAIAYLERKTIYFTAENVQAPYKLAFIHNDYSHYPFDRKLDEKYFVYYNKIAAVSKHCREVLVDIFPQYAGKFIVVRNTISSSMILAMAQKPIYLKRNPEELIIVTVGRLVKQKGYDTAIRTCKLLCEEGIPIRWYAIGAGPDKEKLKKMIEKNNLDNHFFLAGATTNPYNWMLAADIYVQPSRFEGFGITVSEAKALNKKIVCSDIPEFREQLGGYPNVTYAEAHDAGAFQKAVVAMRNKKLLESESSSNEGLDMFYSAIGEYI